MTFITESELRELWKNGRGKIPSFPKTTRFSAAALDFIKAHQIEIFRPSIELPIAEQIKAEGSNTMANWDKPGQFPVMLSGKIPVCQECGQPVINKPEHITQIDSGHFAPKTSPRLILRGRIDSLHAMVMLTASISRRFGLPELGNHLDTLAAYCREIMSAEYHLRLVAPLVMMDKSENQIHEISHWPEKFLGIPHIVPGSSDHEILHWLNLLRTQSREVEIIVLQVFPTNDLDLSGVGAGLTRAFNRLSSAVYVLELYFRAGILSWKVSG